MKTHLNIMVAICLAAFALQSRAASGTSSWTTLFPGIEHATGWANGTGGDPYLKVNCLRIDLANPNIEFVATPHTGWGETMTQKTGDFLVEHNVQVAINAQSGSPADGGDWVPRWDQDYESDASGALVSQGSISSPEDTWCQELRIDRNNQATILQQPDMAWPYNPGTPVLDSNVWTAICGYRMVLTNGVVVFGETGDEDAGYYIKSPQQSIGLSQDGHYLYLTTVDGRQPGVSEGLNMHDFGLWLLDFGVYEAIMLSGGGSATMVKSDGVGGYDFVGIPVGSPYVAIPYDERHLPANFGVRSLPPGSRAWNAALGDWATSANWDTGTLPYKPDDVAIANGGTARITQAGACSNLILGAAGNGTLELVGGDTVVGGDAFLTV
ncbi:MAG: phosphodiester glycosidase family protein, partial [Lentisphaeria bacterium]|nr:phosphodiester glycosidase family protein [Lentisphaeria bacterium]